MMPVLETLGHLVWHPVPLEPVQVGWTVLVRGLQAAGEASLTVMIGLLVAVVLRLVVPAERLRRFLNQPYIGPVWAGLLAVVLPVCALGVIPVVAQLRRAGVCRGSCLVVLMAGPMWNPLTIAMILASVFAVELCVLLAGSLLVVVGIGILWQRLVDTPTADTYRELCPEDEVSSDLAGMLRVLGIAARQAGPLWLLGVIGSGLAAGPVPPGFLSFATASTNPWAAVQMGLGGLPAYVPPHKAVAFSIGMLEMGGSPAAAGLLIVLGAGMTVATVAVLLRDLCDPRPEPVWAYPAQSLLQSAVCGLSLAAGLYLGRDKTAVTPFLVAYVIGGIGPASRAWESLRQRQFGIDLLMVAAALASALIGAWAEGVVLLLLFSLSGALESLAAMRAAQSLEALLQLQPEMACRLSQDGSEQTVPAAELRVGDCVRVRPGTRIPADGVLLEGLTEVDESLLTGESRPVPKATGQTVLAGSLNGSGAVTVQVSRSARDSSLARIVQAVTEAQESRTVRQQRIERWQGPYVLAVMALAGVSLAVSLVVRERTVRESLYDATVLLVAASPCAVVLAGPSAMLAGLARGAQMGILFRSAAALDALSHVSAVAFDKTGTLTQGRPRVIGCWMPSRLADREDELLAIAGSLERGSEHPLAAAVVDYARQRLGRLPVSAEQVTTVPGLGVVGQIDGRTVAAGRAELFMQCWPDRRAEHVPDWASALAEMDRCAQEGFSALLVADPQRELVGVLSLTDTLRPHVPEALASLRLLGIDRLVLLSGDHPRIAERLGGELGFDNFAGGLSPLQKARHLQALQTDGVRVAMIGDGVNDAPALATAEIGVAFGRTGTDVARQTADVTLMSEDLRQLSGAVYLARQTVQRAEWNLRLALASVFLLCLATMVGLPLWLAVIGHEGTTVLVAVNGLRLLWARIDDRRFPLPDDGSTSGTALAS